MSKSITKIHRAPTKEDYENYYKDHILVIFQDEKNTIDKIFEKLDKIKENGRFEHYIRQKKLIKDLEQRVF